MSFILAEDAALKSLLSGLTVSDEKNAARRVGVWYGLPDPEKRDAAYPFITIDLIGVAPALDRARSGPYVHDWAYAPEGVTLPTDNTQALTAELPPQPFNLDYQITTWTRNPRHDRQLLASLLNGPLPYQFGQVTVDVDQTTRRLDLTGLAKRDILEAGNKRLYRNVFTARISSELYLWQLTAIPTVYTSAAIVGATELAPDGTGYSTFTETVPSSDTLP